MGRKVHPLGFRLGIIKDWQSRWYADRNYADLAVAHEERDWRSQGTWNRVQRMPAGPAAVITPWNAPFMLSTWKTAPARA